MLYSVYHGLPWLIFLYRSLSCFIQLIIVYRDVFFLYRSLSWFIQYIMIYQKSHHYFTIKKSFELRQYKRFASQYLINNLIYSPNVTLVDYEHNNKVSITFKIHPFPARKTVLTKNFKLKWLVHLNSYENGKWRTFPDKKYAYAVTKKSCVILTNIKRPRDSSRRWHFKLCDVYIQ
jgi:hypothetical protein